LAGAKVAVIADADDPGREHAREVAASLEGIAREVRLREPAVGKDAADHLVAGLGASAFKPMVERDDERPSPEGQRAPIRYLDVAKMGRTDPPAVKYVAKPIIPRGALVAVYGQGGLGKSFLAGALSAGIGHGSTVAGIECQRGYVLYADGENGEHEIHRRVRSLDLPAKQVSVGDADSLDLRRHMQFIEQEVAEKKPDLLVLDSFRTLTPGMDEKDTAQMAKALDPLRRLAHRSGTAVLVIHHHNKGGKDFRGATTFRDSVDVLWRLGREKEDEERTRRFLVCEKMRVAPEPDPLWLCLQADRGRVLIDAAEPYEKAKAPPEAAGQEGAQRADR
jgi:KaiC/GvpD/RAD55 family RecA-like ATPase